jgi:hypothetical protein
MALKSSFRTLVGRTRKQIKGHKRVDVIDYTKEELIAFENEFLCTLKS